jgi:hypothetical protein
VGNHFPHDLFARNIFCLLMRLTIPSVYLSSYVTVLLSINKQKAVNGFWVIWLLKKQKRTCRQSINYKLIFDTKIVRVSFRLYLYACLWFLLFLINIDIFKKLSVCVNRLGDSLLQQNWKVKINWEYFIQ